MSHIRAVVPLIAPTATLLFPQELQQSKSKPGGLVGGGGGWSY